MFKSILVPLDGSHFAEHAVPIAASLAHHAGAKLRLLQVLPPLADRYFWAPLPGSDLDRDLHVQYRAQAQAYLDGIGKRVKGLDITCRLLDEHIDVPEAIEKEVVSDAIDLVVMASHCPGALKRFWLGSIADQVYRRSSVPVLLAHPHEAVVDFDRDWQPRHILVALDGSIAAEQVLEAVLALTSPGESELHLLRVTPAHPSGHPVAHGSASSVGAMDETVRHDPPRYLEVVAERLRDRGARVRTQTIVLSDPAEAILRAASGTDLIAMQTRAEHGMPRLVHGSVVAKVVHNSHVPVLITRPHKV